MGASESSCLTVTFSRSNSFYFAGEQISGNISFVNDDDKLTLDEVFIELVGEIGYTTHETRVTRDFNGATRSESYTKKHVIPFLTLRTSLVRPEYGQHKLTFSRGQYSWPFEFRLPDQLPPSVTTEVSNAYIKYYTRIVLEKPWYKLDKQQVYHLTIFPHVNLVQMNGNQPSATVANHNRKQVQLQGHLVHCGVLPGQSILLQISLQNPKRTAIKHVEAILIQRGKIGRIRFDETIFRTYLPDIQEFIEASLERTYSLLVPFTFIAPTYSFNSSYCGSPIDVSVEYKLKLDVDAHGLFTDFKINVPIIIGTESPSDEKSQLQSNQNSEMSSASAPTFDQHDLPPSYESVINNEKNEEYQ